MKNDEMWREINTAQKYDENDEYWQRIMTWSKIMHMMELMK